MANTTGTGGAPKGNNNRTKNQPWADALRRAALRAIDKGDYKALDKAAEALLAKAADGDVSACKELGDRLDGKAIQPVEQTTEHSGAITFQWAE